MLSDNSEKTRNPLKKAMRRRNAKTVQFAAPTYVEASDYDYSSDEEGETTESYINGAQAAAGTQQATTEEAAAVEQKEAPAEVRTSTSSNRASFDREQAAMAASALAAAGVTDDEPQLSPKLIDKTGMLRDYVRCKDRANIRNRGCTIEVPKRNSSERRLLPQRRRQRNTKNHTYARSPSRRQCASQVTHGKHSYR
jgi:hypothetical protein